MLLLFGCVVGYGYMIEAVIYNALHSYHYDPNFIAWNSFYDSNSGALASNMLALPAAAVAAAMFDLRWRGFAVIIGLFAGIEWLFQRLEIYDHIWWKTIYTSLGLPMYLYLAKWIWRRLLHPVTSLLQSVLLYLVVSAIAGSLHIAPIMLVGVRSYHPGWFSDFAKDTTAMAAIFYLCISVFYVWTAIHHWRHSWLKYALAVIVILLANFALQAAGILQIHAWWDSLYYIALALTMTWISRQLRRQLACT